MAGEYFCYTDGACKKGEGAPGGWGLVIRGGGAAEAPYEAYGSAVKTSSERMELTAIAEALKWLPAGARATIFSDSQAVLDLCSRRLPVWRKNGWKNVPAERLELCRSIDESWQGKSLDLRWEWLRGHNGNAGNERADALAAQGAREARKLLESEG